MGGLPFALDTWHISSLPFGSSIKLGTANPAGLIDSLSSRADPPGARRIAVAVELKSRHVVVGAPAASDRQALAGLGVNEHDTLVGDWLGVENGSRGIEQREDEHA